MARHGVGGYVVNVEVLLRDLRNQNDERLARALKSPATPAKASLEPDPLAPALNSPTTQAKASLEQTRMDGTEKQSA